MNESVIVDESLLVVDVPLLELELLLLSLLLLALLLLVLLLPALLLLALLLLELECEAVELLLLALLLAAAEELLTDLVSRATRRCGKACAAARRPSIRSCARMMVHGLMGKCWK
jgi:hypothetical protein